MNVIRLLPLHHYNYPSMSPVSIEIRFNPPVDRFYIYRIAKCSLPLFFFTQNLETPRLSSTKIYVIHFSCRRVI